MAKKKIWTQRFLHFFSNISYTSLTFKSISIQIISAKKKKKKPCILYFQFGFKHFIFCQIFDQILDIRYYSIGDSSLVSQTKKRSSAPEFLCQLWRQRHIFIDYWSLLSKISWKSISGCLSDFKLLSQIFIQIITGMTQSFSFNTSHNCDGKFFYYDCHTFTLIMVEIFEKIEDKTWFFYNFDFFLKHGSLIRNRFSPIQT